MDQDNNEDKACRQGIWLPTLQTWLDPIEILLYFCFSALIIGPAIREAWSDRAFDRKQAFLEIVVTVGAIRALPTDKIYEKLVEKK